ncbi:MAG TPA: hypothetical protein VF469_32675 [Kofleriaceae bacterium]
MILRRTAIAAGLVAALYVLALFTLREVPGSVLAWLGGPDGGVARYGGLTVTYRPPAGYDIERYLARAMARKVRVHRTGERLVLEVPGISAEDVRDALDFLIHGGLELREVLDDDSLLHVPIIDWGPEHTEYVAPDVMREYDMWLPEDGGPRHTVPYLRADSRDALEQGLATLRAQGWSPPPRTEVVFERIDPDPGAMDRRPLWRTYIVADTAQLDGDDIADAVGSYDPNTHRPIVLLDFTRDGAAKFGELTSRIVGRKLATMVGGVVRSAPIINGPIRGGRASITMGGGDPLHQERARDMLVRVMHSPTLPRGGVIEDEAWTPAPSLGSLLVFARLVLALVAGVVVGGLSLVVLRFTRPVWRAAPAHTAGALPLKRIAATLVAPFALVVLGDLPLPFIGKIELAFPMRGMVGSPAFSPVATGIQPLLSAFIVVELATLVVPRLYRLRHVPRVRIKLGQAVAALGIAFALLQSYIITSYLDALALTGADIIPVGPGLEVKLAITVSITVGTLLLALAAGVVREHGLGNGYGAVIATTWLLAIGRRLLEAPEAGHLFGMVGFLTIAVLTWFLLRARIGEREEATLRLPASGRVPLSDAGAGLAIVRNLMALGVLPAMSWIDRWTTSSHHRGWIMLALVAGFAVLWSFLFARPQLAAPLALRAKLLPTSAVSWRRATLLSAAVLLAIAGIEALTGAVDAAAHFVCDASTAMLVTAVVLDLRDELRARRTALVAIWPLQQPQHAEIVAAVLREAAIPFHLKGGHLRALLAFFGPYVPIDVMVPAEHADAARSKIAWLFEETPLAAFE